MSRLEIELDTAGPIEPAQGTLFGEPLGAWRERTRRELGIAAAPGGALCGAGHQPGFWHPGILAKFIHARRLAGDGGAVVHLVVDHDEVDPAVVEVPILVPLEHGARLGRAKIRLGPPAPRGAALRQPSFEPWGADAGDGTAAREHARSRIPGSIALESVAQGLERAGAELANARNQPNAAMQVAAATTALMQPWVGAVELLPTSRLLRTTVGDAFIESMRRDPARCIEAFNEALRLDARAARALRRDDDPELPLWTLDASGRRRRVRVSELRAAVPPDPLLPTAFLLSAIMRLAVCDRFVHGLGARRYERVTEAWFRAWLGTALPPCDFASATCTLPLDELAGDLREARSEADHRRAWWDPESLDATAIAAPHGPGDAKRRALAEIAGLPRGSPQRRDAHRRMLQMLDAMRRARATAFRSLETQVLEAQERASMASIANDRTWPFVYFEPSALEALASRLRASPLAPRGVAGAPGASAIPSPPAGSASGSGR